MPVTGISATGIDKYTAWLSAETGREYRLPTLEEWQIAAQAGGESQADRNCVARGRLKTQLEKYNYLGSNTRNGWGLAQTEGNARELVTNGSGYSVAGGAYSDSNKNCKLQIVFDFDGSADELTGFRLVRNI
jgi:formylglycine-generating enzyme required for sulfatase activity